MGHPRCLDEPSDKKDGNLLVDFHASSLPMKGLEKSSSNECKLELGHDKAIFGQSKGGLTPPGWSTASLPCLVEFDHGYAYDYSRGDCPEEECIWGIDEIGCFADLCQETQFQCTASQQNI